MAMEKRGLAKLAEECGELVQVAAKKMAYMDDEDHPDGSRQAKRLTEEMGDVLAAIRFTAEKLGLDVEDIMDRAEHKYQRFLSWDSEDA